MLAQTAVILYDRVMEALARAEDLLETSPRQALQALQALAGEDTPVDVRAQAIALLAMHDARRASAGGLRAAEKKLTKATELAVSSSLAQGRLAHARGYLAFKRGERDVAIEELNRAASLYGGLSHHRARVFDTLGMLFSGKGDLGRARAYYLLSLRLKKELGRPSERHGIAVTCGNLGRLELAREEYFEAEHWFREDLELVLKGDTNPTHEAIVRNQLALALLGQGEGRAKDAEVELERALELVRKESSTHAFVLKDLARASIASGDLSRADDLLRQARTIATQRGYTEAALWIRFAEGQSAARRAKATDDSAASRAFRALDEALDGFTSLAMHRPICDVAIARAELQRSLGLGDDALESLLNIALPCAERHLFGQIQPLARIESMIESISSAHGWQIRVQRMIGSKVREDRMARLHGVRHRVTVWTCDIRGFTSYCDKTGDPVLVVNTLNRFFSVIGQRIVDEGGSIDKYVGDNILAYFRDPQAAAQAALAALEIVDALNTEREHLDEPLLEIGIGLASGEVVEGNVGFAGKLEHTIIGTPVNVAFRLVGSAEPSEILLDAGTREALGARFEAPPIFGGTRNLKGIGDVAVYVLERKKESEPPKRKADR